MRGARSRPIGKFIMAGYTVQQRIIGFHQDEYGDWVAELECGHGQHVRHDPPFQERAWVLTPDGRAKFIGVPVVCKLCAKENTASN